MTSVSSDKGGCKSLKFLKIRGFFSPHTKLCIAPTTQDKSWKIVRYFFNGLHGKEFSFLQLNVELSNLVNFFSLNLKALDLTFVVK